MSLDSCKNCGHFVDTDFDCCAYSFGKCLCENCRESEFTEREVEIYMRGMENAKRIFDAAPKHKSLAVQKEITTLRSLQFIWKMKKTLPELAREAAAAVVIFGLPIGVPFIYHAFTGNLLPF